MKLDPNKLYGNLSFYIPKHEKNFVRICDAFRQKEFPDMSFSGFVLMCMKHYINSLDRQGKKNFEDAAYALVQKEKPKATEFVDKFISKM